MRDIKYSLGQLYLLAFLLPLLWKLGFYFLNASQFISDDYSWIRLILVCLLFFFYLQPASDNKKNVANLISLFITYIIVLYTFDILINHYFNESLKYEYLQKLYSQYLSDGSKEELESINSSYSMSSKERMIEYKYNQLFTPAAYLKSFAIDIVKYLIISILFVSYQTQYHGKQ